MMEPVGKLLRVPVANLRLGQQRLERDAAHYLIHVHRAAIGAQFCAFDVEQAAEGTATLVANDGLISIDVIDPSTCVPRERLILIQAFGKGSKIDGIVRDATVLDVTELRVVSSKRSAVTQSLDAPGRMQRWVKIAVEAARQCERGDIPKIEGVIEFADAVAALESFAGCKWLLSPTSPRTFSEALASAGNRDKALLIGPEGGFDDDECAMAKSAGFEPVRLGARILRSETAVTAALGAVAAFRTP
jgi:16S rRNA (uracil1498-N3)-methyltransferase